MGAGVLDSGPRKNKFYLAATILSLIFVCYTLNIFSFRSISSPEPLSLFPSSIPPPDTNISFAAPEKSWSRATLSRPNDFGRSHKYTGLSDEQIHDPNLPPKVYRPATLEKPTGPGIEDNFPLADNVSTLPTVPPWNMPPKQHVNASTPLLIGFTRGWLQLQQAVVSFIAAGWPREDIYVIENTGTMYSNRNGLLSLQNPFFLNHTRLKDVLGVNIIETPTLLTFSQLQNFYIHTALEHQWPQYFWGHMDIIALSDEAFDFIDTPYKSLYFRAVDLLHEINKRDPDKWGMVWFKFDQLSLVHTERWVKIGGWDTMIPFYQSDCDFYERIWMNGYHIWETYIGQFLDVNVPLEDLSILYYRDGEVANSDNDSDDRDRDDDDSDLDGADEDDHRDLRERSTGEDLHLLGPAYKLLFELGLKLQEQKAEGDMKDRDEDLHQRNSWQRLQRGGQGEPFYRDADGFQRAIDTWTNLGWNEIWL